MNMDAAFEIVKLALSLARSRASGHVQSDVKAADILSEIVQTAARAYRDHTGEALDPSLIKAEEPINESRRSSI